MSTVFVLVMTLVAALILLVGTTTLMWMLDAWRTPDSLARTGFGPDAPRSDRADLIDLTDLADRRRTRPALESFSLIVPARHEEHVLGETIDRLARLDHPDFEVLVVIGHDDPGTQAVADRAAARHPDLVRVVIDHNWPKNKPKALNTALPECRGSVVGVFDAEDEVAAGLLRSVESCMRTEGADVVQGAVQLMNFQSSWWALHNVLEYFFYFHSRLHFQARQRFIPLGGNTVFIRRDLLVDAGGWDPDCLAEDCEVGVRLSVAGARVAVAYDPALATREETPADIRDLVRQRTRWNQGFLQVLAKGAWRELPSRRQRLFARYTLALPLLQALAGVVLPLALLSVFLLRTPVLLVLFFFLPAVVTLTTLAVLAAGLGDFARQYGFRAGPRDYLRLTLGLVPYQVLLAIAAVRATVRQARSQINWEKTTHVGAHRHLGVRGVSPAEGASV
jgi:cellulose synthase/poly-beta-1,6-N-acetylglucosamine synthase-like glycosyltransferase